MFNRGFSYERVIGMSIIIGLNLLIGALFFMCYFYQILYVPVSLLRRQKPHRITRKHRYAVLISARNEEIVIRQLIDSIHQQTYDRRLITVFVIADNCTDQTARIAREAGAVVYERFNQDLVGKGYALDELLRRIRMDYSADAFDGYFVFDADNVLSETYIEEMNKTFCDGYRIITSYRNSKNYGDNWISAGYALWFLREAKYLNNSRMLLGGSCAVSGTGFLFSREILEENGGWPFHLLTEDIEFTVHSVVKGEKIGYCPDAVLFDEQPTSFRQSWNQRLRWAKGFLQVFHRYGGTLIKKALRGDLAAFDLTMTVMPAMPLTFLSMLLNLATCLTGLLSGDPLLTKTGSLLLLNSFGSMYITVFLLGLLTLITEWKQIHTPVARRILFLFTFPLFQLTYLPISFVALYRKVVWSPIVHTEAKTVAEICSTQHIA